MTAALTKQGFISHVNEKAASYNLDPAAVLAISSQEGLGGGIGDGGHAFGPFQLNDAGGAFPASLAGLGVQAKQDWAWSPAGIDFALERISGVAGGMSGWPAIHAIATFFERPRADLLAGEIAGAWAQYMQWRGGGVSADVVGPIPVGGTMPIPGIAQPSTPTTGETVVPGNAIVQTPPTGGISAGKIGAFEISLPTGLIIGLLGAFLLLLGALLFGFNVKAKV